MPVIRIDDATFERLKRWAEPLEDSPADALRKVLDYAERRRGLRAAATARASKGRRSAPRLPKGEKLPQSEYYWPILESLYELGGRGHVSEVLPLVERKLKAVFRQADRQMLSSGGDVRWRNTAQWARYDLVRRGLLRRDSQRGVWELTDAGIRAVEGARSQGPAATSSMLVIS
jgi:hypothetical protein